MRGRRSIWCGWRVMPVAPRFVNDVSYVTRINDATHVSWQAQYLARLEGDACCSAHCTKMTFHMSRGSMMRVIFRGRHSTW